MYSANRERSQDREDSKPTRIEVLTMLWQRMKWLDGRINNQRLKLTPIQRHRVFMVQTLISGCKTLLYGLKDDELESRIMELEEKLKGAVLIPDGSEQQKAKRA